MWWYGAVRMCHHEIGNTVQDYVVCSYINELQGLCRACWFLGSAYRGIFPGGTANTRVAYGVTLV